MHTIIFIVIAIVLFIAIRHRSTARAIKRAADRNVWAQASDTRYPRRPRTGPFARRKGLK